MAKVRCKKVFLYYKSQVIFDLVMTFSTIPESHRPISPSMTVNQLPRKPASFPFVSNGETKRKRRCSRMESPKTAKRIFPPSDPSILQSCLFVVENFYLCFSSHLELSEVRLTLGAFTIVALSFLVCS